MGDLISRCELFNKLAPVQTLGEAYAVIQGMQTAPEIIRCKDCKFWQDNNSGYPNMNCRWIDDETPDADDFCSYAERRQKNG